MEIPAIKLMRRMPTMILQSNHELQQRASAVRRCARFVTPLSQRRHD